MIGIAAGVAHVWLVWTDNCLDADLIGRCEEVLSLDEKERYRRFSFDRDRRLYLASHATLRHLLSAYTGVAPEDLRFECNNYGRPELAANLGRASLRFNLSHTRGLAAYVLTRRLDCGIDVESATGRWDTDAIVEVVLSSDERMRLSGLPEAERRLECLRHWTVKEAYVKARGMGMSLPMEKCSVTIRSGVSELELNRELRDDARDWQIAQFFFAREYSLAVALRSGSDARARILLKELVLRPGSFDELHRNLPDGVLECSSG